MNFNLRTALSSIAPTLATMLGGPLAGTAVTALESAFGLAPGSGTDAVTAAVAQGMTPETIAAVRAQDQKHLEILGQQHIDLDKLNADHDAAIATVDAGDRASARGMQIANHSRTPAVLSGFITTGFFGILAAMMVYPASASSPAMLIMLGALTTAQSSVIAFWFGSTHDSFSKTQMIAQSAAIQSTPPER